MSEARRTGRPEPPALDTKGRIETKGDVVAGDNILFYEAVRLPASEPNCDEAPSPAGYRVIKAEVVRESYGPDKDQHTFTLRVLESSGHSPIKSGAVIWRKGWSINRNGCWRLPRPDESKRDQALQEKHERGQVARSARAAPRQKERGQEPWAR